MNNMILEQNFDKEMIEIYRTVKVECHYNATRFLQMVMDNGGLKTAKKLLTTEQPSDGFTVLWEYGRLDLTVEALVLKREFSTLFDEYELDIARKRLEEYGYRS